MAAYTHTYTKRRKQNVPKGIHPHHTHTHNERKEISKIRHAKYPCVKEETKEEEERTYQSKNCLLEFKWNSHTSTVL